MSFVGDLEKFANKTEIKLDVVVKKVVIDLFAGFTLQTPVETGMARAGWMIGISTPPNGVPEPGKEFYQKPFPDVGGVKAGQIIWIMNNVPYIRGLEYGTHKYGYSPKAPQGMVRITIKKVVTSLNQELGV